MGTPLRVLVLEDNAADAELVVAELRQAGFEPEWQRVQTEAEYAAQLTPQLQLILADYTLPQFNASHALKLLQARGLNIPLLVVSGSIGEETAVTMMREGAADYILKDRLARLGPAVIRTLEQHRLRHEKRQAEALLRKQHQELELQMKVMVGREERVVELKREVNMLLKKLGESAKYGI